MSKSVEPGYTVGKDDTGLTKREREVLTLVKAGRTAPQITEHLMLSSQRVHQILGALVGKAALVRDGDKYVVPKKRAKK